MRTEGLKRGLVPISLAFALVFSIIFLATPVLAEAVISEPGGTTENVDPGQEFVLPFRLQWDEPDAGFFAITLKWFSPENNPAENFTIVGVSAYFDNTQSISAAVTSETETPLNNGTLYVRVVGTTVGDLNNGPFNVDITFLAGSEGFAHVPTGNHPIEIDGSILVAEALPWEEYYPPDPVITVRVLGRGMAVAILPDYQSGPPGVTLGYTVTITNTGTFDDSYTLTINDNESWGLSLSENWFENVAPGENRTATLSVTVPENEVPSTEDNIMVIATSQEDPNVSNYDTCIAHAEEVRHEVEVFISPSDQSAPAGTTLSYTVIVRNIGSVEDNYSLSVNDNAVPSWGLTLPENRFENVAPGENRGATLNVTIPVDAVTGTEDNITVTAISQGDNTVNDNASCIARALSIRGVEIAVSPEYQVAPPETTLTYTVTVTNTGNVEDTYALTVGDSASWISEEWVFYSTLSDGSIENTGANYLDTHNATTGTIRNNVETANIGQVRDVDFTIWRTFLFFDTSRIPDGAAITSAMLSLYGHADGSDENFDVVVQNGQPTYPHDPLEPGDYDNTHYGDNGGLLNTSNFKTDNYNDITLNEDGRSWIDKTGTTKFCLRSSRDNENIEPSGLYEFIEIFMSEAGEGYQPKLTVTLSRTISRLTIPTGENRTATFDVTIPENMVPGTLNSITVTATSRADSAISDYANSVAISGEVALEVSISPSSQSGTYFYNPYKKSYDLKYIVWITNRGTLSESAYDLTVTDNENWNLRLQSYTRSVPAGETENVPLYVEVPPDAEPGTEDKITVVATSRTYNMVSYNAICTARAALVNMEVTISPSYQRGSPGETLIYLLTVKNTGDGVKPTTYSLYADDNAVPSWGPTVGDDQLIIPSGESAKTRVKVKVPDNATHHTMDSLTVLVSAPSQRYEEDGVEKYSVEKKVSSIAQTETFKLFISPGVDSARPGENFTFTVLVTNVGIENDNYDLTLSDDAGWGDNITLSENFLKDVTSGEGRRATLTITISEDAELGIEDNIMVTVIPASAPAASESENCVAIAAPPRGVKISISPKNRVGPGGATITYAVIVKNFGTENDNYDLTVSDTKDWGDNITLSENLLVVPGLGHRGIILEVTLPREAKAGTVDDILITVTSQVDNTVSASASCATQIEIPVWVKKAIVRGDVTGYNVDAADPDPEEGTDPPPEVWYSAGDYPPLMVAKEVENGAVVAAALVSACRNTRWNYDFAVSAGTAKLDVLLDKTFQWMVPGAVDVLWYEGYGDVYYIYNDTVGCSQLVAALEALGYKIEGKEFMPITASQLEPYDIMIVPELQIPKGSWEDGGDPSLLSDNDVQAIANFVRRGGGLLVMEGTDVHGYNYYKIQNKILRGLGIDDVYFQSDQVNQNGAFGFNAEVTEVDFGTGYRAATELTRVYVYSTCSLVVKPEKKELDVSLSISPSYLEGLPGETLTYTLIISNTGKLDDAYSLYAVDNAGFASSVSPPMMTLAAGASDNVTLSVTIPEGTPRGTESRVAIAVTSLGDPTLGDVAHAEVWTGALGASVSISPNNRSGELRENLRFTVFVTNTGDFEDDYTLTVSDSLGWDPTISPVNLSIPKGKMDWAMLWVIVPEDAASGVQNNITVTATSQTDDRVSAENSCIALVTPVGRGVDVLISPTTKSGAPGKELNFDVTVTNTGTETDTFSLTTSDTEGWGPTLSITSIPSLAGGASKTGIQLSVKIPDDAAESDSTTITVTASGTGYGDSAGCTARAVIRGVEISIAPESRTGSLGESVTFTITVTNTSEVEDSYDLTVSDDAGWGVVISEDLLTISAGEDQTTTVSVTVPSDATEGESTMITVTATSRSDPMVSDTATCTASAREKPLGLPIVPIGVGGAAIGAGVAVTLLVKKGMISVPFLRSRRKGMFSSTDWSQSRPSKRSLLNPRPIRPNPGKERKSLKKWM